MFKKVKALFADDPAPPPPAASSSKKAPAANAATSKKAPIPKPAAKPSAAPSAAPANKAPAAASPTATAPPPAPVVAATYLQAKSSAEWVAVRMPPLGTDACFKGIMDSSTHLPISGALLLPTGTMLEGDWNAAGLFVTGSLSLVANNLSTSNIMVGAWVPTLENEKAMNEGLGVRLAAGVTRDTTTYRVFTSGLFGVFKNNYNRLLLGIRLSPRPSAPKDIPCADLLPLDQVVLSAGVMNFDKNVIGQGCVLGATMTAGVYRMDGGVNQLQEGVSWSTGGLVEGKYTRRTDVGNASQTSLTVGNRHIGRWRRGEAGVTHLDLGLRLTCYKPGTQEFRDNRKNYVYCVEAGRFALVTPRRHRSGRKWYQKNETPQLPVVPPPTPPSAEDEPAELAVEPSSIQPDHDPQAEKDQTPETSNPPTTTTTTTELTDTPSHAATGSASIDPPPAVTSRPSVPTPVVVKATPMPTGLFSEGLFHSTTSELIVGVVVSSIADGVVPVWTYKPNKETAPSLQERIAVIPGQTMRSISGFRKFVLRSDMWRTGTFAATEIPASVRESVAAGGGDVDLSKMAQLLPALTEEEALEVERAWYGGEQSWPLHCSGRGDVYFGEHIDEGQWLLHSASTSTTPTTPAATISDDESIPCIRLLTPIVWEERLVESLASRAALTKAVVDFAKAKLANTPHFLTQGAIDKHLAKEVSADAELMGSFSDLPPEWVSLPFTRHEWLLHEIDLNSKISRFALPCEGVIVDAFTASEFVDDALLARLTNSDQAALDAAVSTPLSTPLTKENGSVSTSLGHVNMFGPLRFLTTNGPISQAECQALLASWKLGTHDANQVFVVRHPLVTRARQLLEEGCCEHLDVVDFSVMDKIINMTLDNAAAAAEKSAENGADGAALQQSEVGDCASPLVDVTTTADQDVTSPPPPPEVGQHVSKQFLTVKESFFSPSFKEEYFRINALPFLTQAAPSSGVQNNNADDHSPPLNDHHRFAASVVLHIPLPPDADCFHEYRHSWGFVLEYLHWVALRHSCVALTAVLQQPFRRFDSIRKQHAAAVSPATTTASRHGAFSGTDKLMRLRVQGDADTFFADVHEILEEFRLQLAEVAERVFVAHTPFAQRMTVAKAAPWGHGIVCRFFGDQLSVTAAACEVSMWLAERGNELVRPPSSWLLSQKFSKPLMVKEEDATGPTVRFFKVDPTSLEFCDVHNCLYNMQFPSLWTIVRLERVQNDALYERYVEKRRQIGREVRAFDQPGHHGCNEHRWLAHGTRGVDPMLIAQHGFDHRYSEKGLFGRAAYFAYDPVYSHTYRHETGTTGEAQMFLASVIGGNVEMRAAIDKEIKHPKPGYHSIDGPLTDRFRGLMVYDLDQAYPCYLVTYKYTTK